MLTTLKKQQGFTIIELLIVIVIIAILAAITLVAYNNIQARARDAQRMQDVKTLAKALEEYYIDHNSYPTCGGSTSINNGWCTTADASWPNLMTSLSPYISKLPADPISKQEAAGVFPWNDSGGYDYSYIATSGYCGINPSTQPPQMYIIVYKLEAASQAQYTDGNCNTNSLSYAGSNYRVIKGT